MSMNHNSIHILATQIVPSSEILFIVPARIRSNHQDDVVLVYSTYIELYEVNNKGKLEFIVKKDDFNCNILAAKVLQISDRPIIKQEGGPAVQDNSELPPQLLVLKLSIPRFTMLHAESSAKIGSTSNIEFVTISWPLPVVRSDDRISGCTELLAVSPHGATIAMEFSTQAICAHQLRPSRGMTKQMVVADCVTTLPKMIISKMDFLTPPASDPNRLDMLLLGIQDRKAVAVVFHWKVENGLATFDLTKSKHTFGKEHSGVPLLLIPLTIPGAVMIIDERVLSIYQYGHDGSMQQTYCEPIGDDVPPSVTSLRPPLWTAWARPANMAANVDSEDAIYMAREDGLIRYLEIGKVRDKFELFVDLTCRLDMNIDGAFAAIASLNRKLDVVLIGGSGCDGGIFHVGLDAEGLRLSRDDQLSNWAPFRDAICAPLMQHNNTETDTVATIGEALFMTSGNTMSGHVLRYEPHKLLESSSQDIVHDVIGVDRIWVLDTAQADMVALCSAPWESTLTFNKTNSQQCLTIVNEPTLAAEATFTSFAEDILLHVTPSQYTIYNLRVLDHDPESSSAVLWQRLQRTILATISLPWLVLIKVVEGGCQLVLMQYTCNDDGDLKDMDIKQIGDAIDLQDEPTACNMKNYPSNDRSAPHILITLGYQNGRAELYVADAETGSMQTDSVMLNSIGGVESIVCISELCPRKDDKQCRKHNKLNCTFTSMLVLCGLRTGEICPISIPARNDNDVLEVSPNKILSSIYVGTDSVKLIADSNEVHQHMAFVLCDGLLRRLEWKHSTHLEDIQLHKLRLKHFEGEGVTTNPITSVYPLANFSDRADERLAIATGNNIHTTSIDCTQRYFWHPHTQPQSSSSLRGRPKHLAYSHYLHVLITSSLNFELDHSTKHQFVTSTISILPVDSFQPSIIKAEYSSTPQPTTTGVNGGQSIWTSLPGETLTDLIEWKWPKARTSTLLIASFSYIDKDGTARGLLKYLKVTKKPTSSQYHVALSHQSLESAPGYILAQFQQSTLIYASGNTLRLRPFDWAEKRFTRGDELRLPSPPVFVSVGERYVYVTTHAHGLVILAVVDKKLKVVSGDVVARDGIAHLALEERGVVLVTTKMGEVVAVGLDAATGRLEEESARTTKLVMPSAITRLVRASIRPPWKRVSIPGTCDRDTYGIAVDGSLWNLSLLEPEAHTFLGQIQKIFEAQPELLGADGEWQMAGEEPEIARSWSMTNSTRDTHLLPTVHPTTIDGEILQRVIRRPDAASLLEGNGICRQMFSNNTGKSSLFSPETRVRNHFNSGGVEGEASEVETVMLWLRELLDIVA